MAPFSADSAASADEAALAMGVATGVMAAEGLAAAGLEVGEEVSAEAAAPSVVKESAAGR